MFACGVWAGFFVSFLSFETIFKELLGLGWVVGQQLCVIVGVAVGAPVVAHSGAVSSTSPSFQFRSLLFLSITYSCGKDEKGKVRGRVKKHHGYTKKRIHLFCSPPFHPPAFVVIRRCRWLTISHHPSDDLLQCKMGKREK